MIGKRGQMGKIITSFPVLIGIFIVIGLFLFLSGVLAGLRGPNLEKAYFESGEEDLLLREVSIDGKEMLVFEAIVKYRKDKIEREEIAVVLESLINDGECLLLAHGSGGEPGGSLGGEERENFVFENSGGVVSSLNPGSFHSVFARYRYEGLLEKLKTGFSGEEIYFEYYLGRCEK